MERFEIQLDIVTDDALEAYLKTWDPTTETYTGTLALQREVLDTNPEETIDITFKIADIKNIVTKNSSYSKTINIPETANNRRVFSMISELGYSSGYNSNRKTRCYVSVGTVVVFKGYLQVVSYVAKEDESGIYETLIVGDFKNFNDQLGETLLEDLPWGGIETKWDWWDIQQTWENNKSSEIYYPVIDYGWNIPAMAGHNTHGDDVPSPSLVMGVENFYPAVYLKSYIDRIFTKAGYRYVSNFFNSENFSKMIVPYNGTQDMLRTDINPEKTGTFALGKAFYAQTSTGTLSSVRENVTISSTGFPSAISSYLRRTTWDIPFDTIPPGADPGGFWNPSTLEYNQQLTEVYKQRFAAEIELKVRNSSTGAGLDVDGSIGSVGIQKVRIDFWRSFHDQNSTTVEAGYGTVSTTPMASFTLLDRSSTPEPIADGLEIGTIDGFSDTANAFKIKCVTQWLDNHTKMGYAGTGATYKNSAAIRWDGVGMKEGVRCTVTIWQDVFSTLPPKTWSVNTGIRISNEISKTVIRESPIDIARIVPQNVKCKDFLKGIFDLFNLYAEPLNNDFNLLRIEPRPNFFNSDKNLDWSNKIDLNSEIKLSLIGDTTGIKKTIFKFKDDNDYFNKTYKGTYNETYGQYQYINPSDFATGETKIESIFASTPVTTLPGWNSIILPNMTEKVGTSDAPVYAPVPTEGFADKIFPGRIIRLLYANKKQGGRPTSVSTNPPLGRPLIFEYAYNNTIPYHPYSPSILANEFFNYYPYAGHLDNPYNPSYDLNYWQPKGTFFEVGLSTGYTFTQNNIFQVYWSDYLDEIYNKDSRILTVKMFLDPVDINNFSFTQMVYIRINKKGLNQGQWFKVNTITGYNPSERSLCTVELLKSGRNLTKNGGYSFGVVGWGTTTETSSAGAMAGFADAVFSTLESPYSYALRSASVGGSGNSIFASESFAIGNNNTAGNNLENTIILGNGITAETSNVTLVSNPTVQYFNFIDGGTDEIINPYAPTTTNIIDAGTDSVRPLGSSSVISQIDGHLDTI